MSNQKKTGMAILILDKVNVKVRSVTKRKLKISIYLEIKK